MDNQLSSDQRLILMGKVWGTASTIQWNSAFCSTLTKEDLIKWISEEDGQNIVDRVNALNRGYGDILDCFYDIIPAREEDG